MLLEMTGICKDYMQGKMPVRVLSDVSLQVDEGDYLAIMGPSGSGKTTLMNLIGCLDVPTAGTYLLQGENIGSLRPNKLAQVRNETLGFVFQSFYLLPKLSALDNVALPLLYAGVSKKERRARAEEALKRMGLEDRMKFRPNQLSGGQCQRVAIARAIVNNPKILLADEPTGALDSASGSQIMDIFDELNSKGVTIIMITHEHEVAARAKKVCHIRDGILSGGMPGYEFGAMIGKDYYNRGDISSRFGDSEQDLTGQMMFETRELVGLPVNGDKETPQPAKTENMVEPEPEIPIEIPRESVTETKEKKYDTDEIPQVFENVPEGDKEIFKGDTAPLPVVFTEKTEVSQGMDSLEEESKPALFENPLADGFTEDTGEIPVIFSAPGIMAREAPDLFAASPDVFSQPDRGFVSFDDEEEGNDYV